MKARGYYPILALVLSGLSGVLLAYALPSKGVSPLGWVAFLPLLLAARISRPLIAAGCGLVSAVACALVLAGPIFGDAQFGNLVAAFGALGAVLAFAAGSASAARNIHPMAWPFVVASAGVTAELLSLSFFPINVAISQYQNPAMLKLASYTGIWGVSFLIWLVPAALCTRSWRRAAPALVIAALALIASAIVEFPDEDSRGGVRVAAIQAPDSFRASRATSKIKGQADIVVWPEHCLKWSNNRPARAARSNGVHLVANLREKHPGRNPYNVACLYGPDGSLIGMQRKRRLFGREKFVFTPGTTTRTVRCGEITAGLPICFETQFSGITRSLVRQGAEIILVPVHDPESPNGLFNYLHAAAVPFRAAENGVPVVWAESTGLSSVIDRHGRIAEQAELGPVRAVVARVELRNGRTVASTGGDYFAYGCALVTAAGLIASVVGGRRGSRRKAARRQLSSATPRSVA